MSIFVIIQVIVSVALISAILLQNAGGGLGGAFGMGTAYHTKRGVEKGLFYFTIFLSVVFTAVSILALITK